MINNIQATSSSLHAPSTPGAGQKVKTILMKIVMLIIKIKEMIRTTAYRQCVCPYTHSRSIGWDQKFKTAFFLKNSHVAYQIKENETYDNMQVNTFDLGGGEKVKHVPLKVEMLHIK